LNWVVELIISIIGTVIDALASSSPKPKTTLWWLRTLVLSSVTIFFFALFVFAGVWALSIGDLGGLLFSIPAFAGAAVVVWIAWVTWKARCKAQELAL
jgi:hypothetical protein